MMLPVLSVSLHLLAAFLWAGTILCQLFLHAWIRAADGSEQPPLAWLQRRLQLLQISSLLALLISGAYMMTADIHYDGLFSLDNRWSQLMLWKHIGVGLVVILVVVLAGIIEPMRRQSEIRMDEPAKEAWQRWQRRIPLLQIAMTAIIVILSAALVVQ